MPWHLYASERIEAETAFWGTEIAAKSSVVSTIMKRQKAAAKKMGALGVLFQRRRNIFISQHCSLIWGALGALFIRWCEMIFYGRAACASRSAMKGNGGMPGL